MLGRCDKDRQRQVSYAAYKRLQRFLSEFELPYAQLAEFVVKLLGIPGPYVLAMDRTNWKSEPSRSTS